MERAPKAPIYGISAHWAGRRREKDLWGLPDDRRTPEIEALINQSNAILQHASELHEEGALAVAMHGYLEGVAAQYEAIALVRCIAGYQKGGMEGVLELLGDDDWLQKEEQAAAAALKGYEILTVEQAAVQLQALDAFLLGISRRAVSAKLLETLPDSSETARYAAACRASVYQLLAKAAFQLASDYAEWAQEPRGALLADDAPLTQLADFYGRAGEANEAVFDSLIVNPQAAAHSVSAEQIKRTLMQRDRDYAALAPASERRDEAIQRYFPQGSERMYARLAAGIYSYWRAAALVAKHYSLDAQLDRQLQIVGLERER